MPLEDYRPAQLEPQKLSKEEIANPVQVIHNFFTNDHFPEVKNQLWCLLKTTVTGEYCGVLTRKERSDLLYFYEQLEKLVEATHVIHRQQKKPIEAN